MSYCRVYENESLTKAIVEIYNSDGSLRETLNNIPILSVSVFGDETTGEKDEMYIINMLF